MLPIAKRAGMLPMAMSSEMKRCLNCCYYLWQKEEDSSTNQHCSRCKIAFYCSRECQLEHWQNVHKKQCKYLAGKKVLPLARHDQATCLVC